MKSVLPPELESKRVQIARIHNRLVYLLLGLLALGLLLLPFLVSKDHKLSGTGLAAGFLVIGILEAYGTYRIFQHDKDLCRELGYMCPLCNQPLYEPRASTWLTGICPKCRKSVL